MTGPDKNSALINVAEKLMSLGLPFARLSPQEQVLVAIWELESEVNNGGFDQYLSNSSGDIAKHAPPSLEAIGATKMAEIVRAVLNVFGPAGPAAERDIRQEQLADLSPSALESLERLTKDFFRYPDNLTELLFAHVARHKPTIRGASDAL